MRLAVVSDTHGNFRLAERAVKSVSGVDMVVYAGDYYSDSRKLQDVLTIPVVGVKGNTDRYSEGPYDESFTAEGKTVFVTHGHLNAVKFGLDEVKRLARQRRIDILIFGHTHVPHVEWFEGRLLVNPGSLATPRGSSKPTFATIDIEGETVVPTLHEVC
jgi:putative phosphoesterase